MNRPRLKHLLLPSLFCALLCACTHTKITESPKTGYAADTGTPSDPDLIWTSRIIEKPYDYLGQIETRSWTYDGGIERLVDAGRELRADAVVDIHFERVGFFKTFHAFAIKFK